jgi:hypothetical protein
MGTACGMHGKERGMLTWYWWETHKERDHNEDLDIGGIIMLKK